MATIEFTAMLSTAAVDVIHGQEFKHGFVASWALAMWRRSRIMREDLHSQSLQRSLVLFSALLLNALFAYLPETEPVIGSAVEMLRGERSFGAALATHGVRRNRLIAPFARNAEAAATERSAILQGIGSNDSRFATGALALPECAATTVIFDVMIQTENRETTERFTGKVFKVSAALLFGGMPETMQACSGLPESKET